jgi:plasmid replication initiation protein
MTHLKPITQISGEVIGDRIDGKWITMSNALTRACHGLTLAEKRIIMIAVAKLDSKKRRPQDGGVLKTRIDAQEYADQFGLELHTAHEQLRDAAKVLYERSITFYVEAHNRKGNFIDEPAQVSMRWIGTKVLYPEEGVASIQLSWNPELVPHLTGLRKQFTRKPAGLNTQ